MDELIKQLSEMNKHLAGIESELSVLEAGTKFTMRSLCKIDSSLAVIADCVYGEDDDAPMFRLCGNVDANTYQMSSLY